MGEAKIILDSIGPNGARLTTFELTYPRMVHSEFMTHRTFSRNAASSRAIPNEKLIGRVVSAPALPAFWGANQSGMQAREELEEPAKAEAMRLWLSARDAAIGFARRLAAVGLHKQLSNRVVEPWMEITVVATATEWSNFFALRDHADAQPELAHVARKAHLLYRSNVPQKLESGEWHLPYVMGYDVDYLNGCDPRMVSVGRCAAVSYLNQDKRDPAADVARAEKNLAAGHMSPFEHVAQAMTRAEWYDYARAAAGDWTYDRVPPGNLWGWKQLRKTLPSEHDFAQIERPR